MDFSDCRRILQEGVDNHAYPCAVYAIGRGYEVFDSGAMGNAAQNPQPIPVKMDTLFDMASVSKVLSPTMIALKLLERGELVLTDTLSRFFTADELANAPAGRTEVTLFQLMTHTSGITPGFFLEEKAPDATDSAVIRAIIDSEPVCRPGEQVYYSCMGYILLQKIMERITGKKLNVLARELVFGPLGMTHTCYNPTDTNVAWTEYSKPRGYYIHGEVHDENAYHIGGVSGNAGVFSNLEDMIKFVGMCSAHGRTPSGRFLSEAVFSAAIRDYTPGLDESRGLGFQLKPPMPRMNPMGDLMAQGSYGHTGFTGTSFYVDSENGLWGILLTNAVHYGRNRVEFFRYRRKFYNAMAAGFAL